jgi:perosamine synthetase
VTESNPTVISHNQPTLGSQEVSAAGRVLASGWLAQGKEVEAFEREVCEYIGVTEGHAVALSSGTAALFMALWVLGATGKHVAIPVYSCAALRNAVVMASAVPIPVDVKENSPNIDMAEVSRQGADLAITAHMFGIPCHFRQADYSFPIIEDCAQALGSRIAGRPVGLSGTVGVFSFYATKMITSGGQGGMLISHDKGLVDAVRDYREFDCRHDRTPRFNFQMTDLQAAIGRAQLAQLDHFLQRRRYAHAIYAAHGLPLWPEYLPVEIEPSHYRAILRVSDPERMVTALKRAQVRAIVPIEDWELLADANDFPHAKSLTHTTVSIPIHPSLSEDEIRLIADVAAGLSNQPYTH